jgi:hypothetical protein
MLGISSMATSGNSGKADQRAARKTRLAAALRENLKRRKQQARQRAVADKSTAQASSQASSHETEADGEANAEQPGAHPTSAAIAMRSRDRWGGWLRSLFRA